MKTEFRRDRAGISVCTLGSTALLLFAALAFTFNAQAGGPVPGHSKAFGASLAQWQEVYWAWTYGGMDLPTDQNGNTVSDHVVLMPIPETPGDGTPGSIDVTLSPGQPFMLPLWIWLGASYDDGTPDDPPVDLSVFETLDITVKIDGATVIDCDNVMDYYSEFDFDPAVPLPPEWSPYMDIVWFQGIGMAHPPLSAGRGGHHTINLDVKNIFPVIDAFGDEYFSEYHNTWNVTVEK